MTQVEWIEILVELLSMLVALGIMTLAIIYYHDYVTSNKYHVYRLKLQTKWNERAQMRYDYKYKQALLKSKGKQ